jgi:hypothetical protein
MIALANLDAIQQILDAAHEAGLPLVRADAVPLTDEQMRAAEEQLAMLEETMRKDPN